MNIDKNLILIKGEDKTASVASWRFDKYKPVVYITYNNGKSYPYNTADVNFFNNPKVVALENRIALKNDIPASGAVVLQFFGKYCRIVYKTGYKELVPSVIIKIVESAFQSPKSKSCFDYLKQLAIRIGLVVEGHNILAARYEKIAFYNNIRQQIPFVTSDNPVLFSDIKGTATQITKLGLMSDRMVILFPITPSILIGIYSPNIYFGKFKDYDGKRVNIDDEKFIMKVNTEIISQSYIHSFLPEPLFTMVNEIA